MTVVVTFYQPGDYHITVSIAPTSSSSTCR
jgi:hypothetical protein